MPANTDTTFISELDPVSGDIRTAAQGGAWPADLPIGPNSTMKTVQVSTRQLQEVVGGNLPVNQRLGADKHFRFLTQADADANGGGACLEALDYRRCCLGETATIEFYRPAGAPASTPFRHNVRLLCVYDGNADPARQVFIDGSFPSALGAGNLVGGAFVEVGTAAAAAAAVRRYNASITNWLVDESAKILFAGDTADSFFTALQAGQLPSPVKGQTDAYWRVAAAPTATDAYTKAQADARFGDLPTQQTHTQQINANTTALAGLTRNVVRWDAETVITTPASSSAATPTSYSPGSAFRVSTPAGNAGSIQLTSAQGSPPALGSRIGFRVAPGDNATTITSQSVPFGKPSGPSTLTIQPSEVYELILASVPGGGQFFWQFVVRPAVASSGGGPATTDALPEGTQNLYFTAARALAAVGGRHRGPWAANTAYRQFDWVEQNNLTYYAKQDFTSGASFQASNWQQFGGISQAQLDSQLASDVYPYLFTTFTSEVKVRARAAYYFVNDSDALRLLANGNFTVKLNLSANQGGGSGSAIFSMRVPKTEPAITVELINGATINGASSLTLQPGDFLLVGLDLDVAGNDYTTRLFVPGTITSGGGSGYTLPQATATQLGGLKLGSGLSYNSATGQVDAAGGGGTGIDYANPVTHTADAALTANDLGKLHILSGNTPLTLTLPAGVAAGASVAVQVDGQSTALHTIAAANGTSLDGRALLRVWAGELRGWRMVGGVWNKTNGYVLPMSGKLRFPAGANQTAANGQVALVQVSEVQEQTGIGLTQAAQYRIRFPRAGNWKIGLLGNLVGVPTGSYVEWLARLNGQLDAQTVNGITAPAANNGSTFSAVRVSETRTVAEGDYVELVVYVSGGDGTVDNRANVPWLLATLYVEEQAPY